MRKGYTTKRCSFCDAHEDEVPSHYCERYGMRVTAHSKGSPVSDEVWAKGILAIAALTPSYHPVYPPRRSIQQAKAILKGKR